MEIRGTDYTVVYDDSSVTLSGSLRLNGTEEYQPIAQLLESAADSVKGTLRLDLRELETLNSSGIHMLSKFVIKVRQNGDLNLVVLGAKSILWQRRSLKNLQRLDGKLVLEMS